MEWDAHGPDVSPAILFLHGLGSNARYWDRVAGCLPSRRRVALDVIPADADQAALAELVTDIAYAVDELELPKPVVVGHSWGAALGLELVVTNPQLAAGFVFVDGPIFSVARAFSWEEVQALMQPPFHHYASVEEAVAELRGYLADAWDDDLTQFVAAGLKREEGGFVSRLTSPVRLRILRDLHDSDPESLWPKVGIPAGVLIARKSDATLARSTEDGVMRMAEIAPAVAIKRFSTPHDIPLYAPLEVAREIEEIASRARVEAIGR